MTISTAPAQGTRRKQINLFNAVQYEHLVAGITGGLVATLLLHPLDLIKIRFAVNNGQSNIIPKYSGITNAFATIYRKEGFRGLYRGVTTNCCGAATSWGLYFLFYNTVKTFIQKGNTQTALPPTMHLLAATQAGAFTVLITNPISVVKTRLCLQYCYMDANKYTYNGLTHALIKIYTQDGIRGYYRGLLPGLFGVPHYAIQFMTYEELKNGYNRYNGTSISSKLGTIEYISFAAISKLLAAATTYPHKVVRARLQNQHLVYSGILDCVLKTWTLEGWHGFYKGIMAHLLRVVPATMIIFVTYENVSGFLLKRSNELQAG